MKEERGTVVEMDGLNATVQMDDGGSRVVSVPEMLDVEVGTTVKIVDPGDGKPIFLWGQ
jgi:hypothetical protein